MPNGAGKETMPFTKNYFYVKDVNKIQGHAMNGEFFNKDILNTDFVMIESTIKGLVS